MGYYDAYIANIMAIFAAVNEASTIAAAYIAEDNYEFATVDDVDDIAAAAAVDVANQNAAIEVDRALYEAAFDATNV